MIAAAIGEHRDGHRQTQRVPIATLRNTEDN